MKNKEDKITYILSLPYETVSTEIVFGLEANVSYNLRMYSGPCKVTARIKHISDHVEIKAYGLVVIRHLEFLEEIPGAVEARLRKAGYKISEAFNSATLNKDFGYLTAQNNELNHLMHRLHRLSEMVAWEELPLEIRKEVATWGELVVDVSGHLVYDDELSTTEQRVAKRNPFAKAGRLALKKKLQAQKFRPIKDFFNGIGKDNNNDKGVDM